MKFRKISSNLIVVLTTVLFLFPKAVFAVCPVCTIAVISGVELSRWLGFDDTISGVWTGGLVVSLSLWLIAWLSKKTIRFPFRNIIVFIFFYVVTILSLYWMKMVFYPGCSKIWGYDKLIVGIVAGSVVFILSIFLNNYLKNKNGGKVYFAFQKVVIPLSALIIASVIFHFITKCKPYFLYPR